MYGTTATERPEACIPVPAGARHSSPLQLAGYFRRRTWNFIFLYVTVSTLNPMAAQGRGRGRSWRGNEQGQARREHTEAARQNGMAEWQEAAVCDSCSWRGRGQPTGGVLCSSW